MILDKRFSIRPRTVLTFAAFMLAFTLPLGALAQGALGNPSGIETGLRRSTQTLGDLINTATEVTLLAVPWFGVLLVFVWSMTRLIITTNVADAEKRKQANTRLMWGIVAMFVVFSIPGLLWVLWNTFFPDFDFGTGSLIRP